MRSFFRCIGVLALLVVAGCEQNTVVAEVGRYKITKRLVAYRDAVERVYNPNEKRDLGLFQLTRLYTLAEIYQVNGEPVTPELVLKEEKRIDRETGAPERLAQVKNVFGQGPHFDHQAYLDAYVMPIYVEHAIYYDFFLKSPKTQARSLDLANAFLREAAASPERFADLAKAHGYTKTNFTVSLEHGFELERQDKTRSNQAMPNLPRPLPAQSKKSDEAKQWVDEIVKPLKPGAVSPKIIDGKEVWQIVRYVRPKPQAKDSYEMQSVAIAKDRFDDWLKEEKAKIKISVRNGYSLEVPR